MRRKTLFTNFVNVPYFTKQDLFILADKFHISETSLNTLIQRAIKSKTIIPLKRNYYVTKEFFIDNRNRLEYKFYLANILLKPSYISRETALQYYGLLSEANLNYYTSTTSKLPRKFGNSLGTFEYRNIKSELLEGYKNIKFSIDNKDYSYVIAEPYKAIFDYIYYRTNKKNIPESKLLKILDELRVSYGELEQIQVNKLINSFK
ncbi:MAG: hypothetical protein ABIA11_03970 [Patescibacteria group bacterium]|nr:hypothetical protein [Patescibacteria group bacterium]